MASLSDISIKRPVLASVLNITIILFGVLGLGYLSIREYPSVDPPVITVSTSYPGANPDIIESQITEPIEEEVNAVAGIKQLTSVSNQGRSSITAEFELGYDLDAAANDIRDKVSAAVRSLPEDAEPPTVNKSNADSRPIILMTVFSTQRGLLELAEIGNNIFKENLQTIPGVSEVRIYGEKEYAMRLKMDPMRMAAYSVTAVDVRNALGRENIELPAGRIKGNNTELTIRTQGRLYTEQDFNGLIVKEDGQRIVRFRDIGDARLEPLNQESILKQNGVPMIGLAVVPQPGANQLDISNEFYKRLDQLRRSVPEDLVLTMAFDNTDFIRTSISEVQETILVAFILVVLVILFFLRDWRTTLVPLFAIPVSLIGTFFALYLLGYSINVLTLLGIVLAIGLVVDDAIVMTENIYDKIERGDDPMTAGIRGANEIFFAIIATTIALVSVFVPLLFLAGVTGQLFVEFAITIMISVAISSFVSLSLIPMLSTRILKRRERHNWFYRKSEPFFAWLNRSYKSSLTAFLRVRWAGFALVIGCAALSYWLFTSLPSELVPAEDRNQLMLRMTGPEGATFQYMDEFVNETVVHILDRVPETRNLTTITSPGFGSAGSANSGMAFLRLYDGAQYERRHADEIQQQLNQELGKFPSARSFVSQPKAISSSGFGLPVQFVLQNPSQEKIRETLPAFLEAARQDPTFSMVDVDLKFNKPELMININREKARTLGLSITDIASTLQAGVAEQRFGYFLRDGKQYQIIGEFEDRYTNEPGDLQNIYLRNATGELIPLTSVIEYNVQTTSPQLYRFNRLPSATVSANLAPGRTMGEAVAAMERVADEVLDPSFTTALAGESRDYQESSTSLLFTFGLALIMIYLALAAQFESFIDPFIILLTVPLATAGALFALWVTGETLNIFSQIGMVMLIGLVTKNAILIVEFANQKREAGVEKWQALVEASAARFRPILMTSFTTILSILPIALALGSGSESRVSMGVVVVGGLLFGTLVTLFVIPAIYTYLSSDRKYARREAREIAAAAEISPA